MRVERARELLAAERRRLERALAQHARQDDGEESDPFYNPANLAADLYQEEFDEGLTDDLRRQLDALERAFREVLDQFGHVPLFRNPVRHGTEFHGATPRGCVGTAPKAASDIGTSENPRSVATLCELPPDPPPRQQAEQWETHEDQQVREPRGVFVIRPLCHVSRYASIRHNGASRCVGADHHVPDSGGG